MYSKLDNIEIMMNDKVDEVMKELFDSLKSNIKIIWNRCKGSECLRLCSFTVL